MSLLLLINATGYNTLARNLRTHYPMRPIICVMVAFVDTVDRDMETVVKKIIYACKIKQTIEDQLVFVLEDAIAEKTGNCLILYYVW